MPPRPCRDPPPLQRRFHSQAAPGTLTLSSLLFSHKRRMDFAQHNAIVNFIWNVADDVLRDVYVRGKYRDVILPMTVIRRLDAVLEPTKPAVLAMKERLDKARIANQDAALKQAAG